MRSDKDDYMEWLRDNTEALAEMLSRCSRNESLALHPTYKHGVRVFLNHRHNLSAKTIWKMPEEEQRGEREYEYTERDSH